MKRALLAVLIVFGLAGSSIVLADLPAAPDTSRLPNAASPQGLPGPSPQTKTGIPGGARPIPGTGKTLMVGPGQIYPTIASAAQAASIGDTILIEPGAYDECAVFRAPGLTIRPIGWPNRGRVHVRDVACERKAIFVIKGDYTTVQGIMFSGAHVPDYNGAGIRAEAPNLTVRDSIFVNNENGILMHANPGGILEIEDSVFERNGSCERDCAHGIYINQIDLVRIINSVFQGQKSGHHVKSRALRTEILSSRIEDGPQGTASYLIDLPNGGDLLVRDTVMEKGPRAENRGTAIFIGGEGVKNTTRSLVIEGGSFRNDLGQSTVFVRNYSTAPVTIHGTKLTGPMKRVAGP